MTTMNRDTRTSPRPDRPPEPSEEAVKDVMAHESPEGRPAAIDHGMPSAAIVFAVAAVLLVIVAGVVGALVSFQAGAALAVIAIGALLVANPITWALLMRARDRANAAKHAAPLRRR